MTTLDDIKQIQKLDKSNLAGYILAMPEQIEQSLKKVEKMKLPSEWINPPSRDTTGSRRIAGKGGKNLFKNVCLCGMGGSAVANHLITNLPLSERKMPMQIVRGYEVPAWVDKRSLVILTSHSGATQETLSAFKQAVKKNAGIFIIAERGQLEELGQDAGAAIFDYDTQAPPRASLGYQLGAVFGLLNKLKIINAGLQPTIKLIETMHAKLKPEVATENNWAKKLAYCCLDRLPIIVGAGILQSVVWRWKTQLNENAKQIAFTEFLPEAMHNAIQGLDMPAHCQDDLMFLILENSFDNSELKKQFEKFKDVLSEKDIRYEIIQAEGKDIFSQKLSVLIIGDWVSFYLAILNNVDPTPVDVIEKVKK